MKEHSTNPGGEMPVRYKTDHTRPFREIANPAGYLAIVYRRLSSLAMGELVIGMPVQPGYLCSVAPQAKLAHASVAAIHEQPLVIVEPSDAIERLDLWLRCKETLLNNLKPGPDVLARIGRHID